MILPGTIREIGDSAFYGNDLFSVRVPSSVTKIGNDAFKGNPGLVLQVEKGSYAETYAKSNGIPVKYYTSLASRVTRSWFYR